MIIFYFLGIYYFPINFTSTQIDFSISNTTFFWFFRSCNIDHYNCFAISYNDTSISKFCNLAIFNILPFPALDGAHIVFTVIEWIRKKPINRKVEGMIHGIGLIVLLWFVVVVEILSVVV